MTITRKSHNIFLCLDYSYAMPKSSSSTRKPTRWDLHVKQVKQLYPHLSLKELLQEAKKTYTPASSSYHPYS